MVALSDFTRVYCGSLDVECLPKVHVLSMVSSLGNYRQVMQPLKGRTSERPSDPYRGVPKGLTGT